MVPRGDGEDLQWHLQEVIGAGLFLDHVQGTCGCHGSTVPQGTVCMPASKGGRKAGKIIIFARRHCRVYAEPSRGRA